MKIIVTPVLQGSGAESPSQRDDSHCEASNSQLANGESLEVPAAQVSLRRSSRIVKMPKRLDL